MADSSAVEVARALERLRDEPPSLQKADAYFAAFQLESLRVRALDADQPRPLFESLDAWFDAQLPMLARPCASQETILRCRLLLAPPPRVRHLATPPASFVVEWLSGALEPVQRALLGASKSGPKPAEGLATLPLVTMVRVESGRITAMFVDYDREGLRDAPTLEDVLLTDTFGRCLAVARGPGGSVGELEPRLVT